MNADSKEIEASGEVEDDLLALYVKAHTESPIEVLEEEIPRLKAALNLLLKKQRVLAIRHQFADILSEETQKEIKDQHKMFQTLNIPRTIRKESIIKKVQSCEEIPDVPLCILPSGEFGIRVAGVVIKGACATIKRSCGGTTKGLYSCKMGMQCPYLSKPGGCSFWHPPEERFQASPESRIQETPEVNNLTPGSWTRTYGGLPVEITGVNEFGVDTGRRQHERLTIHLLLEHLIQFASLNIDDCRC